MTIRTAMVLAAGRGERMRPLTDSIPKPLLKVNGKPLIHYHLEALKKAGFEKVVINHAWLGNQIERALGDGGTYGLELIYSPESQALETAGGIVNALPLLCPTAQQEYFAVINGDVFTHFDFSCLPKEVGTGNAHLVMVDNPFHNPEGDFYFAQNRLNIDDGNKLTFSGLAVYHKQFFANTAPGVKALAPLLRKGIAGGLVSAQYYRGTWTDVGTPERLAELNKSVSG